jgi:hypothetical protein
MKCKFPETLFSLATDLPSIFSAFFLYDRTPLIDIAATRSFAALLLE